MSQRDDVVDRFRERLWQLIERSGGSRAAFARRCGIDRSTLSQILSPQSDRLPRVETLAAIAHAAQVSLDWLVGLSEGGEVGASILPQTVHLEANASTPSDERLQSWHDEAVGYKIRYVPSTIPDLLKTNAIIDYEFRHVPTTTPEQRRAMSARRLAYQRRPETDMEVCSPIHFMESFVHGEGLWKDLPRVARKLQLEQMARLCDELYPTLRWFFFDGLERYSIPLTIFGPLRAVIYVGHMYLVLNGRDHVRVLARHFDRLIRGAVMEPTDVIDWLRHQHAQL